jgi:Sec-independent protein translocase protein TatA
MLDFSPEKMVMIFLIVLIVLGPEKLPEVSRKIGKAAAELRKLSGGFQDEIRSAVHQATNDSDVTGSELPGSAGVTETNPEVPSAGESVAVDDGNDS